MSNANESSDHALLTAKEACEFLRIKGSYLNKAIKAGQIPAPIRIASKRLFLRSALAEMIAQEFVKAQAEASGGSNN